MKFLPIQSVFVGLSLASLLSSSSQATQPKIDNLVVTGSSGAPGASFAGEPLDEGSLAYLDRTDTYKGVPTLLLGADYIVTRTTDKSATPYTLSFDLNVNGALFLFLDNRIGDNLGGTDPQSGTDNGPILGGGTMDWVAAMGFVDSGLDIGIDEANDGSINNTSSIYYRMADAGHYTFGVQNDLTAGGPGNRNFYAIACAPVPEPGTLALLGVGGASVVFLRRRKS